MNVENKTKKGTMEERNRLEDVEKRSQSAHMKVHEIKTLLTMWDIIQAEASSGDEVDWAAVLLMLMRFADEAIAELNEIESIASGVMLGIDVAQRGC